jgi:glucose/arabinose dehydrogenase
MTARRLLVWAAVAVVAAGVLATAALVVTGAGGRAAAQNPSAMAIKVPTVRLHVVASGLSQPLGVTAPRGDTRRLFIVEKTGYIRVMQNGKLLAKPFLDVHGRVSGGGEQGLLSLAFDPAYATNKRFYVYYTARNGDIKVVRYLTGANPDVANAASAKILWTVAHHVNSNHNGGQLAFGPDGRLYIGVGDGGSEGDPNLYGQNVHVPYAKIWTMDVSSASPRPVLYAYGLRNPWRFSFDPATGNLWIGDVGQDKWEEIDFLKAGTRAGTNFGWSYYEGDHVYKPQSIVRTRLVFPVTEYSHALGDAVVGGYVYRGSAIAALKGRYLFADYGTARVWFKTSPGAAAHILTGISQKLPNVSSFGQNAQGELFLSSLNGKVYKLVP